ncbi:hypothetical protein KJ673_03975 [Patescibacteria group bacterium]|nr:hypothetical protein [Patescibacteria group bacterium]MCG2687613.1 hypothetical protein [Candidatus Parcubacteria bacterium]
MSGFDKGEMGLVSEKHETKEGVGRELDSVIKGLRESAAPIAEQLRGLFPPKDRGAWFGRDGMANVDTEALGAFVSMLGEAKKEAEVLQANIAIERSHIEGIDATERGKRIAKLKNAWGDNFENKYFNQIEKFMPRSMNVTSPTSDLYEINFEPFQLDLSYGFVSDDEKRRYQDVIGTFTIIADQFADDYFGGEPEGTIEVSLDPSGTVIVSIVENGQGLDKRFAEEFTKLLSTM